MPLRILRASPSPVRRLLVGLFLASVSLAISLCAESGVNAQNPSEQTTEEVVANLAAGRVVLAVVKDAILIATIENPFEAQTHPPTPVVLSEQRAGVILGAVDWFSPSSNVQLARLDHDLPRVRGHVKPTGPRLQAGVEGNEATDIEFIGEGLGDRLNEIVKNLHAKMDLPEGEPLVQLVVADFEAGYGPEVWHVDYSIEQFPQRGDFWETRVPRPRFLQDWPPEKEQPRTLIEFDYPPGVTTPTLLELLRQKDPRLEKLSSSDPVMASVASMLLTGISNKIATADATQFLRAALNAIAPPNARQTMAVIGFKSPFAWILPPPNEPKPALQQKERPSGAPTLLKPGGN
ncbi:MAG TPA: hypothetical protein VMH00_04025 [Candidatus Limnocylindrales bacterium]|nr:hypothetical protein [Candidatus Limnocylindrales bacterium]